MNSFKFTKCKLVESRKMATIFRPQALPVHFYYGVPSVLMLESCFWFSKLCLFGVVGFALFPGRVFFCCFTWEVL